MAAYEIASKGRTATYERWNGTGFDNVPVTLGEDDVVALVLDGLDDSIVEWFTADTYWETVQNFATSGKLVVLDTALDTATVKVAIREAELYADCFGE